MVEGARGSALALCHQPLPATGILTAGLATVFWFHYSGVNGNVQVLILSDCTLRDCGRCFGSRRRCTPSGTPSPIASGSAPSCTSTSPSLSPVEPRLPRGCSGTPRIPQWSSTCGRPWAQRARKKVGIRRINAECMALRLQLRFPVPAAAISKHRDHACATST